MEHREVKHQMMQTHESLRAALQHALDSEQEGYTDDDEPSWITEARAVLYGQGELVETERARACVAACDGIHTYQLFVEDGKPNLLGEVIDTLRERVKALAEETLRVTDLNCEKQTALKALDAVLNFSEKWTDGSDATGLDMERVNEAFAQAKRAMLVASED